MKQLFRRLFKRTPWWNLEMEEVPDPDSRRVTRESASPLNKVLVRPAVDTAKKEASAADRVLGNSKLEVAPEEFNPYNTGAFDRASSWDKISRQKKR
jgi:hypothetical protein